MTWGGSVAATSLRRLYAAVALFATACALMLAAPGSAAYAAPGSEGGSKKLEDALESAAKGQADAIQKLNSSKKRQADLQKLVVQAQAGAKELETQVGVIANRSYRLGRTNTASMLLDSSSPDVFLERVERLDMMAQVDGSTLKKYEDDLATARQAKSDIDREVAEQQKQVTALGKKKKEAEIALASIGGGAAGSGFLDPNSALAKAAPRNSDGSWPKEGCTINDPTTTGCITPRLLNAYQNARAAGFTHYVACFRHQDSGEHPKGRACDFSAHSTGFVNEAATGADKDYGNRLAAYFIKNSDRLGVMYVIWYRQIWMPGTGWKAYSGTGDAAAVHTNHVHLSIL
jgi:peptidoglycan DL-endopeptidase CwlO